MRIVAAIAVIGVHSVAGLVLTAPIGSHSWWIGNMMDSAFRWCVPVFFMVSGALLIRPQDPRSIDYWRKTKKRLTKICVPLLFWAIVYFLWYTLVLSGAGFKADFVQWLKTIAAGSPMPGHLYFLVALAGLYIATPFINAALSGLTKRSVAKISIVLVLAISAWHVLEVFLLRGAMPLNLLSQWAPYTGYYVLGYGLSSCGLQYLKRYKTALFVICASGSWAAIAFLTRLTVARYGTGAEGLYFYEFVNPLVLVSAVATFVSIDRLHDNLESFLRQRKKLSSFRTLLLEVSSLTFGVYLAHFLVLMAFQTLLQIIGINLVPLRLAALTFVATVTISFSILYVYRILFQASFLTNCLLLLNRVYFWRARLREVEGEPVALAD